MVEELEVEWAVCVQAPRMSPVHLPLFRHHQKRSPSSEKI